MKQKKHYVPPVILEEIFFQPEGGILAPSIVDDTYVLESTGQAVDNIDAEDNGWNNTWEW